MDDYKSGHRNRIKAKYLENSANLVYDYEVLELLLTYSIPRRDVKPVQRRCWSVSARWTKCVQQAKNSFAQLME